METTTPSVATFEANTAGTSLRGAIIRDDGRFVYSINGTPIARAPALGAAAHRLAEELRSRLQRRAGDDWGVEVHCSTRPGVGLLMGNRSHGGKGSGVPDPCVAQAIQAFDRSDRSLAAALEIGARVLADCCE
jgi:hypothetical protein